MEKEGFIRCVRHIEDGLGLDIRLISTDRHNQIKKLMSTDERFTHIIHQFDPWHISKSISKKLCKIGKRKGRYLII